MDSSIAAFRAGMLADVQTMIGKAVAGLRVNRIVDVPFVLGAPGTALTTSDHLFLRFGLNGSATVIAWSLAATKGGTPTSGSVTLDVRAGSTLSAVSSIVGGGFPALSAASELADQSASGWSALADPTWLKVVVTAADGNLEVVGLTLRVRVFPR